MKDLNIVLNYKNNKIRLGIIEGELMFSVVDLCLAVTGSKEAGRKLYSVLPEHLCFNVTAVDKSGSKAPNNILAVTKHAGILVISRLKRTDPVEVLGLIEWLIKVDVNKIKSAE